MPPKKLDAAEERAKMLRGELYWAFVPELIEERAACARAYTRFNKLEPGEVSRREQLEMIARCVGISLLCVIFFNQE